MQLDTWLKGNKLSLNVAKTNCMPITTKQVHSYLKNRNEDLHLTIHNKERNVIKINKYLGVEIDNSLNRREHVQTVSAKVSEAIGFTRHAKATLPQETLKTYIQILWSQTFDIAPMYGVALVQLRLISYKNFSTGLLGI